MNRVMFVLMIYVAAAAVSGCAMPISAAAHVDHTRDFSVYRTFAWGPADALPTGDPRLDGDPLFKDRMQGAIEIQLRTRGLVLVDAREPDLLVHYHATINQRIDVNSIDIAYGYCPEGCEPHYTKYEGGTLVLDVIDYRTQALIWRGWARTDFAGALTDGARMVEIITQSAAKMLQHFPHTTEVANLPRSKN